MTTAGTPPALETRQRFSRPRAWRPPLARTGSRCRGSNCRRDRLARHTARSVAPPAICDLLQLAVREEADEPAVRRPERERPAFGARNRPGCQGGDRPQVDLIRGLGPGDEHDVPAIRRHRHLSRGPGPSASRTAKRRVLRRRDGELSPERPWASTSPAGRRATTRPISIDAEREHARSRPRHDPSPSGRRSCDDGCAGVIGTHRRAARRSADAPRRCPAAVPLGSFFKQRVSSRRRRDRRRRRQRLPVGLLQQDGGQRVGDVVAREGAAAPVSIS